MVDTNILLDMALDHRPDAAAARNLLAAMASGRCTLAVSAGSLKDFYYIARRDIPEPERRAWVSFFLDALEVYPVDSLSCRNAVDSDEPDLEDGIVRAIAEAMGARAIISRDSTAFEGSLVRRLTAAEFLAYLER